MKAAQVHKCAKIETDPVVIDDIERPRPGTGQVLVKVDAAWAVRMLGSKVKHVHVKDAFGRPGVFGETFTFPFLGEGVVDWLAFFRALDEVGCEGFLSLEFENDRYLENVCGGDWSVAAVQLKERADALLGRALPRSGKHPEDGRAGSVRSSPYR